MSSTTLATTVLGSSRLLESGRLRGKRVGIVANPASIDQQFVHVVDRLLRADGVTLGAIFGPQHGFNADLQENMIETPHAESAAHRVKVFSLYSETREPTLEMLDGLDVLVVDLQDVGTRIYTFIYTMAYCLTGAAKAGIPVIVCDRPNPIGGVAVEGPMLERGFESFVGLYPIPMRHGLTIGELARLFNDTFGLGADLTVEPMNGWSRQAYFDDTDVPWVMPSPNMPTLDAAIVYPGQVLFEGTMLSEARGTTRPFELCGAPWLDANALAGKLNAYRLPGAMFRPVTFEPTFHKHAKTPCHGVQIHVTDRSTFESVLASTAVLHEMRQMDPAQFAWRPPPYEYEHRLLPIDILAGTAAYREDIERGTDPRRMAESWKPAVAEFERLRQQYRLY
ncbi:MAG: DUF1343 domain-containing protein [Vicinamibacteraceae bacterium]